MSGTPPKSFSAQPADGRTVKDTLVSALTSAEIRTYPYRHVLFKDMLPKATMDAIKALPIDPPGKEDGSGRRETQNSQRVFMSPETQKQFAVFDEVASLFQSTPVIRELEALAQRSFAGGYMRVEYCQDIDGFWLEPHLDISAKWVTMLIYLSDEPEGESWGTDIYTGPSQDTHLGAAPCLEGNGLLFVAGKDTWHGFHPKKITGVRRSLIVNVVSPDWRARHELAFPDHPLA